MSRLAEQFLQRFRGLMRAHGTYMVSEKQPGRDKVTGRARTLKDTVTQRKWRDHLEGKVGIGIVPVNDDGICLFGAIDVDVYDLNLEHLETRVKESGLPLVVCRTKSGGAHLYLFLSEPTPASLVRDRLMEWSVLIGHPNVEVFPKQSEIASEDDVGSWINMPYFDGESTVRYAIVNGEALSPTEFLEHAETAVVTEETLVATEGKQDPLFEQAPPCLQHLARTGFPEGTRNLGLYNLGVYAKMAFGDDWKDRLREMNKKNVTPMLSDAEVTQTIRQLDKKNYFYKCKEQPIANACNRSICSRREYGISKSGDDPGVSLDGLAKILTTPPMWLINVDGRRVQLDSSAQLLSQREFERKCIDAHNIIPNRIKENAWRELLRMLMEKVEEIPAPEDAGTAGQFLYLLEKFCRERDTATSSDELVFEKVWTNNERSYFQSSHLIGFVERHRLKITAKTAWGILRDNDGDTKRFRIGKRMIRAWSVPAFPKQKVDLHIPRMFGDDGDELIPGEEAI